MATSEIGDVPAIGLPDEIDVDPKMGLTPNEMRALKGATGRDLTSLLGGDENDLDQAPDRIQALIWVALRRAGHRASWDQAGDVQPRYNIPAPDPTNSEPSTPSPGSAATGA